MKKTVKLLSLAAAIAMAATMTGCGGTKTTDENTNASATPASSDKKTLTMATNAEFPPFEYLEGDQIVGADVDMAKAVAEKLGYELEITNLDFDAALAGVSTGKYDVAVAGITASEERKRA